MGVEIDKLTKQLQQLEHENRNLQAKDRHVSATGGHVGGGARAGGGMASTEKEQRKIMDLESLIEGLQTENAVSHVRGHVICQGSCDMPHSLSLVIIDPTVSRGSISETGHTPSISSPSHLIF